MPAIVGEPAPLIDLPGVDGTTGEEHRYRSVDVLGKPLVLVFYPQDSSPVCTRQLVEYTRGIGRLDELGATVWALSPQDLEAHREFAAAHGGFGFPLLADVERRVGDAYGVLGLLDLYRRSIVVVDADGMVRWTHRSVGPGMTYRPLDELVAAVLATL